MVVSVNRIYDQLLEKYDVIDNSLIPSKDFTRNFGDLNDYIEVHLYTKDDVLIHSEYDTKDYKLPGNTNINSKSNLVNSLVFDPSSYLEKLGYVAGDFKVDYRIYRKKLFELASPTFFISEISKDRTEIRLSSTIVSDLTLESNTLNFIYEIQTSQYFKDFLLNFGDNKVVNAVNIALDKNTTPYSIVIKLYQPLPSEFDLKSTLWVVEELADPVAFEVVLVPDPVNQAVPYLKPANFDVDVNKEVALNSTYQNLNTIYSTNDLTAYQNVLNLLSNDSVGINVDYSNYSNFVHFSSAAERLNNFVYKLTLLENSNYDIATIQSVPNYTYSLSASVQNLQNTVNGIIQKFDGYERYLYYSSESNAWPKNSSGSVYSVTSSQALAWLGSYDAGYGMLYTASVYDRENQDNLVFSVPEYISSDSNNDQYLLFLNMIGQHFDNVWIYIKAINDLHKATNSLKDGISKDMVFSALKSLGIKVYNENTNDDVFTYFLGNTSGNYTVTSSLDTISSGDNSKEIFKRIYHNLPYLLKSKGTNRGIKALISTFGIPSTILDVIEYGGADKFTDTLEYAYDRFAYSLKNTHNSYFDVRWAPLTQNSLKYGFFCFVPDAIELRFKADPANIKDTVTLIQNFSTSGSLVNFGVTMNYTSSNGVPSANINLLISDLTQYVSASVVAPVYMTGSDGDTEWWNLLVTRRYKYTDYNPLSAQPYDTASLQIYDLYMKTSVDDMIGFQYSASIYATGSNSGSINRSWSYYGDVTDHCYLTVGAPSLANATFPSGSNFYGYLQEFRYWSEPLSEWAFDQHVLNPEAYEGNTVSGAFNDLAARFPLGNNLVTYNHATSSVIASVHPNYRLPYSSGSVGDLAHMSLYGAAIYGQNVYGASGSLPFFLSENNAYFYQYDNVNNYVTFYDRVYTNAPNSGYYTPVTEKVRIVTSSISSSVLSPFLRLEQPDPYRTKDIHFTDVSFSLQNSINKDIISQYGSTLNIDDFIGDPRQSYSSSYSDLSILRDSYFNKYANKPSYNDLVNLVNNFNNSLFKMIEDYAPARTNLSTGLTLKSPLIERNKVNTVRPVVSNDNCFDSSIPPIVIAADNVTGKESLTGEYAGLYIGLDDNFEKNNYNPYLHVTESVNQASFINSGFNITYGSIDTNRKSNYILKEDPFNENILTVAQVQDDYYQYKRHILPRYEGSKNYLLNNAVYSNSLKFGWVDTVSPKNINFYDKTTLSLKYLIDESGSLTELNEQNNNLFEVQNIFKSGEDATVSLFNKLSPTNQSSLNGAKNIFVGGFSYTPILYRELDETLYFNFLNPTQTQSLNLGVAALNLDTFEYRYLNNTTAVDPTQIPLNTTGQTYYYIKDGVYQSNQMANISFNTGSWNYQNIAGVSIYTGSSMSFTSSTGPNFTEPSMQGRGPGAVYGFGIVNYNDIVYNTEPETSTYQPYGTSGNYYYKVPRTGTYVITGSILFGFTGHDGGTGAATFRIVGIFEHSDTPDLSNSWNYIASTKIYPANNIFNGNQINYNIDESAIWFDNDMSNEAQFNLTYSGITPTLTAGTYVRFKLYWVDLRTVFNGSNYLDFKVYPNSYFEIYDSSTQVISLIHSGSIGQTPSLFSYDSGTNKGLVFNDSASLQFYTQSIFTPSDVYTSSYSPVVNTFEIQPGDIFRFGPFTSPSSKYYEVDTISKTPNVHIQFKITGSLNSSDINSGSFAILRKVPDETTIILNYNKLDGDASKALLIPNDLREDILKNVANIVEPLKVSLTTQ